MPNSAANAISINALPLPLTDVAGSAATNVTPSFGISTYGSVETTGDHDWYEVQLLSGYNYDFRLLGVGRNPLTDPILTLRTADGTVVASNDNANGDFALNSVISFKPTTAGTYYIDAGGHTDSTGDFLLTAWKRPPIVHSLEAVLSADEVAWQLTNNFERYFNHDTLENVSQTAYNLSGVRSLTYNISQLTTAGQSLAVQAMQMWSDVTGISFLATNGAAQLSFDDSDADSTAYNSNVTTTDGTITSSSLMITTGWLAEFGTTLNSYSFETTIHELGHALGLGHGGNYNGSATYGIDNFYQNDSQHLSIMSYMQSMHDEFAGYNTYSKAQFRWVLTPMIADILAMENLYGLSTTTRTGNTTYGYNSNTGNVALDTAVTLNNPSQKNYVAFTIFDNGGIDTVDMSGFAQAQQIDLREGASSNVLGGKLNMGIAYGTVVENAYGGSGNDSVVGNSSNNLLRGNSGVDTLTGLEGNDTLEGGAGNDILFGGEGNDTFLVNTGTACDSIEGGLGSDMLDLSGFLAKRFLINLESNNYQIVGGATYVLKDVENVIGSAQDDNVTGDQTNNSLNGMAGSDYIYGGIGNDSLIGGAGPDYLYGGSGADVMLGGTGDDYYLIDSNLDVVIERAGEGYDRLLTNVTYALAANLDIENLGVADSLAGYAIDLAGNDLSQTIVGNNGANMLIGLGGDDILIASGGADRLNGGLGNDLMYGGGGDDWYYVDSQNDVVVEHANPRTVDRVLSYVNYTLGEEEQEVEILTTANAALANAINLTGNRFAQAISGNAGNNELIGLAGNDTISGLAGADTLNGGLGKDMLMGGAGFDVFVFNVAPGAVNSDTIKGYLAAQDSIQLDDAVFGALAVGALVGVNFAANLTGGAVRASDRIIYETDTGNLYYDADGLGGVAGLVFANVGINIGGFGVGEFLII